MGDSKRRGRDKSLHTKRGKGSTVTVSKEMSNDLEEITNSRHEFVLKHPEQLLKK